MALAGADSNVGRRLHSHRCGIVDHLNPTRIGVRVTGDKRIHRRRIAAIIDDDMQPVAPGLGQHAPDGALQQQGSVFGASDDRDDGSAHRRLPSQKERATKGEDAINCAIENPFNNAVRPCLMAMR